MSRHYRKPVSERWHDALTRVAWDDFERRLADYYRRQGYRVEHVGTGGRPFSTDGGIDLKLFRDSEYIVVQCKHWNALQVTHNPMHELIGVMHTQRATGAIIITSGEFTRAAWEAAANFPAIQLIDGPRVREMIGPIDEPVQDEPVRGPQPSWLKDEYVRPLRRAANAYAQPWYTKLVTALVLKITGAVLVPVISYFAFTAILSNFQKDMLQNVQNVEAQRHAIRPAPHAPAYAPSAYTVRPTSMADSSRNAPVIARAPDPSSAELKEWDRKNAESMRILEKTTPELGVPPTADQ